MRHRADRRPTGGARAADGAKTAATPSEGIYDPEYVAALFDRCSPSYRRWSALASFGMVRRWREACVRAIPPDTNPTGEFVDLMAGTGEVWPHLLRRFPELGRITAIDNSRRMHEEALRRLHASRADRVAHLKANVLDVELGEGSADCVLSTFGLKTFDAGQQARIADRVARLLRPGGTFSFIEASDPSGWRLRPLYRLYMDRCLPLVERVALRGARDFSMIGTYTREFGDCRGFAAALASHGLEVASYADFFGCATGVHGRKPV